MRVVGLLAAVALFGGLGAASGCRCRDEAGVRVTVEGQLAGIVVLHVEVSGPGRTEAVDFGLLPGEAEIVLPTTLAIQLEASRRRSRGGALSGPFTACVTARDAAGVDLGTGCDTREIAPDRVTDYTVFLGGTDAGTDAGGTCGNGVRESGELCDASDLGGADCVSLGFSGGLLSCDPSCAFDLAACAGPPTVPVPRKPMNNSYVGSVHVPGSLRPVFVWEPSTVGAGAAITYELQYGTDPAFGTPATATVSVGATTYTPAADLSAAIVAPVGARYHWRVRACAGAACSAYSAAWYVNAGRDAHDLDGDGYAEVVAAAPSAATAAGADAGRVYLFQGGPGAAWDAGPDATLSGQEAGAELGGNGGSLAFADVNADGFADLIVGEPYSDAAAMDAGRAYVYLGGVSLPAAAAASLNGAAPNDSFGFSVAGAGDVDGDGFDDVLVGALQNDDAGVQAGAAYLYRGGAGVSFDPIADAVLRGSAGDQFGTCASAGDVNGDGYGDLVIGAHQGDGGELDSGTAAVFLGGAGAFDDTADLVLDGEIAGDDFGYAVAGAGDLDGDGFADFAVGAELSATLTGRAYVYLGGDAASLDALADATLSGALVGDRFGISLAGAGDVNGDGVDDLVVGASRADAGPVSSAGRAYVFRGPGGATFDPVADDLLDGEHSNDFFGSAVAGAGDVNGDGFADLVIGAFFSDAGGPNAGFSSARGQVYVFFGGAAGVDPMAGGVFTGLAAGDQVGRSVAAPPARGDEGGPRVALAHWSRLARRTSLRPRGRQRRR